MEFWDEIIVTLRRNKWRSLMTMFGVFWGIWMLIVLTGIGNGIGNGIMPGADDIPANVASFHAGLTTIPYRGMQAGRYWMLTNDDMEAIRQRFGRKVDDVSGQMSSRDQKIVCGERSENYSVAGVMPSFSKTVTMQMVRGRFVNQIDMAGQRKVCVIGQMVCDALFPEGGDPCGNYIQIGNVYFMVVGVAHFPGKGWGGGERSEKQVYIPLTTYQQCYNQGDRLHFLKVIFADGYLAGDWQEEIRQLLYQRHLVAPDDEGAMWVFNFQDWLQMSRSLTFGISALLWIVGVGMLLAGLIGISNIVLVTVKERTQEIGVRRAIGARPRTIMMQILSESFLLTFSAGIVGLMLGVFTVSGLAVYCDGQSQDDAMIRDPYVSFWFTVTALLLIIVGGVLAGIVPARRAMKIKAIDALRDE